jgi:O-6-methylguanine DNA methyltransferase
MRKVCARCGLKPIGTRRQHQRHGCIRPGHWRSRACSWRSISPAHGKYSICRCIQSALERIPYGVTISYGEVARRIDQPAAVRAVGAANGRNPLPIIVPCHRVIGSNGNLTGFGGGLPIKRFLLAMEDRVARGDLFGDPQ